MEDPHMYMTGYAGNTMTRDQLLKWGVWLRFEPEFRRRLLMLMDACIAAGKPIGIGALVLDGTFA